MDEFKAEADRMREKRPSAIEEMKAEATDSICLAVESMEKCISSLFYESEAFQLQFVNRLESVERSV